MRCAGPLLITCTLCAYMYSTYFEQAQFQWRTWFKQYYPIVLFVVCNLIFVAVGLFFRHGDGLRSLGWLWWVNYIFVLCMIPAALVLGRLNWRVSDSTIGIFLLALSTVSFSFGLFEYLGFLGWSNPVGAFLAHLNEITARVYSVWQKTPIEPPRAQGLETYPALFGYMGAVVGCWALSSKTRLALRVSVGTLGLGIVVLSGARAVFLAGISLLCVVLIVRIVDQGFAVWFKRNGVAFIAGFLLVGGLFAAAIIVPASSFGPFARTADSVKTLSSAVGDEDFSRSALKTISNGRDTLWRKALSQIKHHPFGTGHPFAVVTKGPHAHNDLLNLWVWGGPILAATYIFMIAWIMFFLPTPQLPHFGLYVGTLALTMGLTEVVFAQHALMIVPLFIMAVFGSKQRVEEELC